MPIREKEPVAKPEADANPRAVIGGNEPPLEERIKVEFEDMLLDGRPDFMVRYNDALAAVDRIEVTDDDTLGKAGDMIKLYRAIANHISDAHRDVKAPYLESGRAVDAEKKRLLGPVEDARDRVQRQMNEFMAKRAAEERAERERIAAEERARAAEAAEAGEGEAAPLAAAAPAKAAPVRSDGGATVSGREVWNSRVDDYAKAFRAVKTNPKVQEAIDKAVAGLVRAGTREINGVTIWPTSQAVAR